MNDEIIYSALLLVVGVLIASITLIFLNKGSNRIMRFFELYPESRNILKISLRFISWFISLIAFLIFFRWALVVLDLEFTKTLVEDLLKALPKYIVAIVIVLLGVYTSRLIRERSKDYNFEFKNRMFVVIDFIVHMTFIFTALYSIGVNMLFFVEFYKVILWIIGSIVALIISMTIGIPLGMSIYEKMKKEKKLKRHVGKALQD